METLPIVIRGDAFRDHALHGRNTLRRAIYPDTVGSARLFLGIAEFGPGTAPHVFHRHGTEVIGDRRLTYAADFEEFYFVVEGRGAMQWRLADGSQHSAPVQAGDAIYMPPGVAEHRIFNEGDGPMRVLYGGSPPAVVTAASTGAPDGSPAPHTGTAGPNGA